MNKAEMTETILSAKRKNGVTWNAIAEATGLSEVYVTSACLGENALAKEPAGKLAIFLGLSPEIATALTEFPNKGEA
jgi:cyanate lyase